MRAALGALEAEIATELQRAQLPRASWAPERRFNMGSPEHAGSFSTARDIVRRWSEKWLEHAQVYSALDKWVTMMAKNPAGYRIAHDQAAMRRLTNFLADEGRERSVIEWQDCGLDKDKNAYVTILNAYLLRGEQKAP